MKVLYLDCSMGASGDMLMASLSQLLDDPAAFVGELNALGIPGVHAEMSQRESYGVKGSHITVTVNGTDEEELAGHGHHDHDHHDHEHHDHGHHDHEHHGHEHHSAHSDLGSVSELILSLPVSDRVKKDALAVYRLIAAAESEAHGESVEHVHFHEVGALDAVADVTGVCMLMEKLSPDKVCVSPVNLGGGTVRCAHGVLPVPAPAVAFLTKNLPCYGEGDKGEMLTPTGAALIRRFADEFGDMPEMNVLSTGTGIGSRDFGRPNCLRSFLAELELPGDSIVELSCGLDDMTGEELGFAMETLMDAGALDAYYTPIYMKKNRPAYMLTVLARPGDAERLALLIFKHTTTLGIRRKECRRYVLERSFSDAESSFGPVRIKNGKPEYEDVALLARENNRSLFDIKRGLK